MMARKSLVALILLAGLSACGEKKAVKNDDQRTASGQILPGSISDAMIPYDALTSQPPVAPPKPKPSSVAEGADSAEDAAPEEAKPDIAPRAD
jgi:hypothetical protein